MDSILARAAKTVEEKNSLQQTAAALETETDPRRLIGTLLKILLNSANARQVCLLKQEAASILAVATASSATAEVQFPEAMPLEACDNLPRSVIRHVGRTGENLLLDGASMARFSDDPYIQHIRPESIVCLPILGRAAILYLEGSSGAESNGGEDLGTIRLIATFAAGAFDYTRRYEASRHRADFLQSAIDALPTNIAILDQNGTIIAVNGAWRRFADANALAIPNHGVGASYLATCDRAAAQLEMARHVAAGIRDVIAQKSSAFFAEYECHSPSEERWFQMRVRPFNEGGVERVVVTHQSITEVKAAQEELKKALAQLAELKGQLEAENLYLQEEIKSAYDFEEIVGESEALRRLLRKIEQVAATNATVLVVGETGTGKELLARAIHSRSPRREHPLVKVNCAALPASLIESELFGHEKGAFTGAIAQRIGRFELANHGTIFLDEIGDLPLELQAKLLRVLQESEFERVGSSKTIKVDVRVIAATNSDLEKAVAQSKFRADLYYRLNVFPISVPPLRERKKDIPLLARYFLEKSQTKLGKKITTVPKQLMDALVQYNWPGNVRELENVIERAVILSRGPVLTFDEPLERIAAATATPKNDDMLEAVERAHIVKVLEESGWKVKGKGNAAERLGMNPSTLRSRIQKLGITRSAR